MESTLDIRKKIHEFIDHADDRILKIINAIILTEEETDKMKPQSFYEELDKRKVFKRGIQILYLGRSKNQC